MTSVALTPQQREWLRQEISRRKRMIACEGCGTLIERTSSRRRYCTRACANRHWHIRAKAAVADILTDEADQRRATIDAA